jgi:hypothetical protein
MSLSGGGGRKHSGTPTAAGGCHGDGWRCVWRVVSTISEGDLLIQQQFLADCCALQYILLHHLPPDYSFSVTFMD